MTPIVAAESRLTSLVFATKHCSGSESTLTISYELSIPSTKLFASQRCQSLRLNRSSTTLKRFWIYPFRSKTNGFLTNLMAKIDWCGVMTSGIGSKSLKGTCSIRSTSNSWSMKRRTSSLLTNSIGCLTWPSSWRIGTRGISFTFQATFRPWW